MNFKYITSTYINHKYNFIIFFSFMEHIFVGPEEGWLMHILIIL